MTVTKFNNRLVTPELREALSDYPLYSQDAKGKDALCIAVFHLGNIRWYIMEGQPEEIGRASCRERVSSPV